MVNDGTGQEMCEPASISASQQPFGISAIQQATSTATLTFQDVLAGDWRLVLRLSGYQDLVLDEHFTVSADQVTDLGSIPGITEEDLEPEVPPAAIGLTVREGPAGTVTLVWYSADGSVLLRTVTATSTGPPATACGFPMWRPGTTRSSPSGRWSWLASPSPHRRPQSAHDRGYGASGFDMSFGGMPAHPQCNVHQVFRTGGPVSTANRIWQTRIVSSQLALSAVEWVHP